MLWAKTEILSKKSAIKIGLYPLFIWDFLDKIRQKKIAIPQAGPRRAKSIFVRDAFFDFLQIYPSFYPPRFRQNPRAPHDLGGGDPFFIKIVVFSGNFPLVKPEPKSEGLFFIVSGIELRFFRKKNQNFVKKHPINLCQGDIGRPTL